MRRGGGESAKPSIESAPPARAGGSEPVIDNRLFVLVLQHPQERREPLATAPATVASLRRARLAVGLSWPNLAAALGRQGDPRRWGVLYLGSAHPPDTRPGRPGAGEIVALKRDGGPLPETDRLLRALEGIVLLDGTWRQAKTLWWRNPWLLKLHRIVLNPPGPARLGRLRREPRREALSTLEAAALVLRHAEPAPQAAEALLAALDRLIAACGGGSVPASAGATERSPVPAAGRALARRRRYRGISAAG